MDDVQADLELKQALLEKLEAMDEALDTMRDAVRAGTIAEGLVANFKRQLDDLRRTLQPNGEVTSAEIVAALDRIAAAVETDDDLADVDEEVVQALEDLADDMGYEDEEQTPFKRPTSRPERRGHDWITPLVVEPGDSVSIYGVNLEGVTVEVDGTAAAIEYQDGEVVVFTAPKRGKGDVVVRGRGIKQPWSAQVEFVRSRPTRANP